MRLTNRELLLPDGREGSGPVVVCDAPAHGAGALADAVAHRRHTLALGELTTEGVLAVRALGVLAETLRPAPGAQMHVLRLGPDDAATVADAAERYVDERDTPSYQPPEERERIAALRSLRPDLRDVQARLMLAGLSATEDQLA